MSDGKKSGSIVIYVCADELKKRVILKRALEVASRSKLWVCGDNCSLTFSDRILIIWVVICIPGSIFSELIYDFLAPIMAPFDAVGRGKEKLLCGTTFVF